jgi:hypothetical protein
MLSGHSAAHEGESEREHREEGKPRSGDVAACRTHRAAGERLAACVRRDRSDECVATRLDLARWKVSLGGDG